MLSHKTDIRLGPLLSMFCLPAGLYLMLKCSMVYERAALVLTACKAVVRRETAHGSRATADEIMEAGSTCAICQVPSLSVPPASSDPSLTLSLGGLLRLKKMDLRCLPGAIIQPFNDLNPSLGC